MARITIKFFSATTYSYTITASFASTIHDLVTEMKWVKENGGTEEELLAKYNLASYSQSL